MVHCSFCRQRQKHRRGYFAILPDGSLALYGQCCAETIGSKPAVANISRALDRKLERAAQSGVSEAIVIGLPELLEILDPAFFQGEVAINNTVAHLKQLLPSIHRCEVRRIEVACDRLEDLIEAADGRLKITGWKSCRESARP